MLESRNGLYIQYLNWSNKELISEGKFGRVYRTDWWTYYEEGNQQEYIVALKSPSRLTKEDIFAERDIKSELWHSNIVNILGFVQLHHNMKVMLVFEYTKKGTALDYIWDMRYNGGATAAIMMRMACDIAKGMEYLHDNCYIHGDLALRNCIMDADDGMLKVGDLGFYEDRNEENRCYFYDSNASLPCPVRWMAPENLPYRFSYHHQMIRKPFAKSYGGDVWAFGVVLYELWSRGEFPFEGCEKDQQVCKHVLNGHTAATWKSGLSMRYSMNKLMNRCFKFSPNKRPNFTSIVRDLEDLMDDDESVVVKSLVIMMNLISRRGRSPYF